MLRSVGLREVPFLHNLFTSSLATYTVMQGEYKDLRSTNYEVIDIDSPNSSKVTTVVIIVVIMW